MALQPISDAIFSLFSTSGGPQENRDKALKMACCLGAIGIAGALYKWYCTDSTEGPVNSTSSGPFPVSPFTAAQSPSQGRPDWAVELASKLTAPPAPVAPSTTAAESSTLPASPEDPRPLGSRLVFETSLPSTNEGADLPVIVLARDPQERDLITEDLAVMAAVIRAQRDLGTALVPAPAETSEPAAPSAAAADATAGEPPAPVASSTAVAPSVAGEPSAAGEPPAPVAPSAAGEPPAPVAPSAAGEPPAPVAPSAAGEPSTPPPPEKTSEGVETSPGRGRKKLKEK